MGEWYLMSGSLLRAANTVCLMVQHHIPGMLTALLSDLANCAALHHQFVTVGCCGIIQAAPPGSTSGSELNPDLLFII